MKQLLAELAQGRTFTIWQTVDAFEQIMSGCATGAQIGAMLAMMQMRGPTPDEITGAARVMRSKVRPVATPEGKTVIDTCGTGGDHSGTFNISTAAALLAAAVGRTRNTVVAKHGNRSVTSKSGSSQVLEELGVQLAVSDQTLTRCLEEAGICFCFAPSHHPAMKHAMPTRQELGFRTVFNILGPLTNPANASCQVIGVFDAGLLPTMAQVLVNLGCQRAMVVHSRLGDKAFIDELSTAGTNYIAHVRDGKVYTEQLEPEDFQLPRPTSLDSLQAQSPAHSAQIIRSIFNGETGDPRHMVVLNAAAAIQVADLAPDFASAIALAQQAIDDGSANATLEKLVELTQDPASQG